MANQLSELQNDLIFQKDMSDKYWEGNIMRKYICDNCKEEIEDISNGKSISIDISGIRYGTNLDTQRKEYCNKCMERIAGANWTFVDPERK
jgi:hypothetical protein